MNYKFEKESERQLQTYVCNGCGYVDFLAEELKTR